MSVMKAWVYRPEREDGSGVYIFLEEVPVPRPGPRDLLIEVRKVSVCGTDDTLFAGKLARAQPGIVPGHEFCGEIVEAGARVSRFRPGQIIAGESHYHRPGALDEGVIGLWGPRMPEGGRSQPVNGAYAEYVCIPDECAHLIPDSLLQGRFWPSLFEPAGNDFLLARHLVQRAQPRRVAVFGCGPHGLYAQIFLKHLGVESLAAFEPDPFRRRFARTLGCAEAVWDLQEPGLDAKVEELTGGGLFDAAIDMVGRGGEAFEQCCRCTRERGTVVLFGLFGRDFEIDGRKANDLIFGRRELEISHRGKRLKLVGVTGRKGIWPDLIETVASHGRLQDQLMKPVTVVGSLELLGQDARTSRPEILKQAFWAFNRVLREGRLGLNDPQDTPPEGGKDGRSEPEGRK